MKNCFFCTRTDCQQVGIDGMWGDGCAMDDDGFVTYYGTGEESDDETEDDA